MSKDHCPFHQLPFSKLFTTYTSDYSKISEFFSANPFDEHEIKEKVEKIIQPKNKKLFTEALREYHSYLGISKDQKTQLNKFSEENSLVIVTGQQLGVYGGPLFTIYKTITTILLAKKWEAELNKPVVPVFWLADEDHDFEEIASIGIPDFDEFRKLRLKDPGNTHPVSVQEIKASIKEFESLVRGELSETDFTEGLFSILSAFYSEGKTHAQAFAQLMNSWFGEEGLLIVGSNFDSIKQLGVDIFKTSVSDSEDIFNALKRKSDELEKDFHSQVVVGDTNLFYLDEMKGRLKLEKANGEWIAGDLKVSEEKLLAMIGTNPHKFSPNVFLRPVLQDKLLPTLGYVAGPGELAYYGQMKELYPVFDLEMPVIFPRLSITLIESGIDRIMEKLPFAIYRYNQRIEDIEAAYLDHTNSKDIEGVFGSWKQSINEVAEKPNAFIKSIDPTLEGTAGKVIAGFSNELDKLKGKVYRSIKQQEQTQLNRISKIKSQIFPDGLQERSVSPVYFMNKYGLGIWSELLNNFEQESLDLSIHHIIKL